MPLYYAVENPMFQRAMRNILSITQGFPMVITTTFDGINPGAHQYQTGLIVRLLIPEGFGMMQAEQQQGKITVLNANQFSMDIDSTSFDPFVVPAIFPANYTPAQVLPVGESNDLLTEATQNVLQRIVI